MIDEKRRTKSNYRFLLLSNIIIFKFYQKCIQRVQIYIKMKFVTLWRCTLPLQKYFYEVYYYLNISNYYVV